MSRKARYRGGSGPDRFDWPVHKQHIDFARYPLHNKNGFSATSVTTAGYWFRLVMWS